MPLSDARKSTPPDITFSGNDLQDLAKSNTSRRVQYAFRRPRFPVVYAVGRGHECATLDSSPNAVGFYVKLGYTPVGPPDDDGAVPMRKALRVPDP